MNLKPFLTYAASADQGAGEAPVVPPANDAPAQPPTAGQAGTQGAPETKFTQADLDRIAGETRKNAKSAERAALLQELGVADVDAAKAAIAAAERARKEKLTDAERAAAERAELEKRLQAAETGKTAAETARQAALLEAEVVSRASGRFANPKAAVKLADLSKIEFKDGKFVGVDEALAALAEAEPWTLTKNAPPAPPAIGATNGAGGRGESEKDLHARFFGGGGARIFNKRAGGVAPGK